MNKLTYIFRYLLRERWSSLVKITSLSLGLLVGIVLFARVAFESSFDSFYPDADNLYTLMAKYVISGEEREPMAVVFAPLPAAMNEEFPEIESATVVYKPKKNSFFWGDKKFEPETMYADSLYFQTFGLNLLEGDYRLLGLADNIFLSKTLAKAIFGEEEPIGKVLKYGKNYNYTVQGIFEDIPENSHLQFEAVGSFTNMKKQFQRGAAWGSDDSYFGYVRLRAGADSKTIDAKIPDLLRKHMDIDADEARGFSVSYYLEPVKNIHAGSDIVKRMILILSLLGIAILFVAVMNYVLISISSLASRAKSVGVYKCNGASTGTIFGMFMYETAILIITSIVIVFLMLLAFRAKIEEIANASFYALFTYSNLWIPVLIICVIFLFAGVIPGKIFSSIPVTQIFRTKTENKRSWKRALLFIQFAGVSFILVLLTIIVKQYDMVMKRDMGYNPDNIVYAKMNGVGGNSWEELLKSISTFKQEFERFPFVESTSTNYSLPLSNYGGMPVTDDDNNWLFTARYSVCDFDYLTTMGIKLLVGDGFTDWDQVIVNEIFVERMGWTDSPIGKEVKNGNNSYGKIVGVVKNYSISSLYNQTKEAILLQSYKESPGYLTLRLSQLNAANMELLNTKLGELYPDNDMTFYVLREDIRMQYESARKFRDSVIAACIIVFLITIMGLFGYISDEITRRGKEIAIRKVNGATVMRILELISKEISYIALPAILLGIVGAYLIGNNWLKDFAEKISINSVLLTTCGIFVLAIILLTVTIRSWKVANEDPVKSLKME